MRQYNEPITGVRTDQIGRPATWVWQQRQYEAVGLIEHWVTTADWWTLAEAPVDSTDETEHWLMQAESPGRGRTGGAGPDRPHMAAHRNRGLMSTQRHLLDQDDIICAWLQGTASRWACQNGWCGPCEGEEMDAALAELRDCATVGRTLRTDLLAYEAGVSTGAARASEGRIPTGPHEVMARLLLAAGGDAHPEIVEQIAQDRHKSLAPRT